MKYNYIPILKSKQGEHAALHNLPVNIMREVLPLIEIVPDDRIRLFKGKVSVNTNLLKYIKNDPLKYKYDENNNVLSFKGRMTKEEYDSLISFSEDDEHIKVINSLYKKSNRTTVEYLHNELIKLKKSLGQDKLFYLDFHYLEEAKSDDGVLNIILRLVKELSLNVIIVLAVPTLANNLPLIKNAHIDELAIRINDNKISLLESIISVITEMPAISLNHVDLIVDFGILTEGNPNQYIERYGLIPNGNEWRKIVFAGASFPVNLIGYRTNEIHVFPRVEWDMWQRLVKTVKKRNICFADYAIRSPDLPPVKEYLSPSANIRYTYKDHWLVVKGKAIRYHKKKYKQFHDLSEYLINDSRYAGANHCSGDRFIFECANKNNTGSLTTWVTVGMTHHITFVIEQLSSFYETLRQ